MNDMIICIGRQYGSGGREIGEKLAARLGVTCYDKLLLKQAAKEGGVSLGEVERQDEKPVSASAFLSGNVFADSASIGGAFYSQSQLVYDAEKGAYAATADKRGRGGQGRLRHHWPLRLFAAEGSQERTLRVHLRG